MATGSGPPAGRPAQNLGAARAMPPNTEVLSAITNPHLAALSGASSPSPYPLAIADEDLPTLGNTDSWLHDSTGSSLLFLGTHPPPVSAADLATQWTPSSSGLPYRYSAGRAPSRVAHSGSHGPAAVGGPDAVHDAHVLSSSTALLGVGAWDDAHSAPTVAAAAAAAAGPSTKSATPRKKRRE